MKVFDAPQDERVSRIARSVIGNQNAVDIVRNFLDSRSEMGRNISTMGKLNAELPEPKSNVEPINPDLAPELYNMVPLLYDIPIVTNTYPPRDADAPAPVDDLFSDEAKARRRLKQAYAESGFRKNAQSKAGAKGLFQIMDITHKDYLGRGRGKQGDIWNEDYNGGIRDWVMGIIPRDLQEFWSDDDNDRNKLAKLYAAYNWGAGNLRSYLRKKQKAGVDISNPDNWVEGLNPETKRYVKFLAFDEDIPGGYMTNEKFEAAARKNGYMRYGGKIHIKPENRGKFTALKKRTGHSASWFKAHGTPAQKKMAVFALNAKKWKHDDGGLIERYGVDAVRGALQNIYKNGGQSKPVSEVWKERTGKEWSQVGDYYNEYDRSLEGNLRLLEQLNAGKYDYLLTGEKPPQLESEITDTSEKERKTFGESVRDAGNELATFAGMNLGMAKNAVDMAGQKLFSLPDYILNGGEKYKDWKAGDVGEYIFGWGDRDDAVFDFSQSVPPQEAKRVYSKYVNGEPLTEWESYECATFITEVRQKMGEGTPDENNRFIRNNNYRGDAWTWLKNAQDQVNRGNKEVSVPYNMYSEGFTGNEEKEEVIDRTRKIAKTPEYRNTIMDNIGPGSVVTLLYPNSEKFGLAARDFLEGKGTTLSTHLGDIVERDGKLYVRDNVGGPRTNYKGHIHYRPLETVLNGKDSDGVLITGIANYAGNQGKGYYDLSKFGIEPNMDVLRRPTVAANASAYRMLDAIDRNKESIMSKYDIDDEELRELMVMALGVSLEESFMGTSENWKADASKTNAAKYLTKSSGSSSDYDRSRNVEFAGKSMLGLLKPYAERFSEEINALLGKDGEALWKAESKGLSNIKYRGDRGDGRALFSLKELEELGFTKEDLQDKRVMESPEVSGVMTVIALKKKKEELRKIMKGLPDELENDEELFNALFRQSWNQGTKEIRETVKKVKNGEYGAEKLLQFKDASLRPPVWDKKKKKWVEDGPWYTDRIASNMTYWNDVGTPLSNAVKKGNMNGMDKEQIRSIQRELISQGFLSEEIGGKKQDDGKVGPNTRRAFAKYLESKRGKKTEKPTAEKKEKPVNEEPAWKGLWNSHYSFSDKYRI